MHALLARQLDQFKVDPATLPPGAAALLGAIDAAYAESDQQRTLAEEATRQAEKLALVASRTDNAVIITDVEGRIEWVNDGFTRISGYELDEVKGRKPGSFLQGPDTDSSTIEFIRQQISRGEGFRTELLNYSKEGRKYWLAIEVQPIYDAAGQLRNFIAIESDITERKNGEIELQKAKEQAEAASRAKSEFLANMSHEIRTPLNGVIGMTDLVLGTDLTPRQKRYVQVARSSADALLVVINQILDFSKIESGKLELESIDFDPRALVEEVGEMLAHRAGSKGIELACRIDPAAPLALRGDPSRLRQILINLVNNALKFTQKGEVVVRIETFAATKQGRAGLRFSVTDTGVGIPPERRDKLFKPFSQVDASTTRKFGGTGLGLAICKQLVEIMRGRIGVESQEGHGSTFWFAVEFPLGESRPATPLPNYLTATRALIVDDNLTTRKILCEQLTTWGLNVFEAADAAQALECFHDASLRQQPIDIALLDMSLPGSDGLELARLLKDDPHHRRAGLVLLTSLEAGVDAETVRVAGLSDAITKPLRQSQLFDAVIRAAASSRGAAPAAAPAAKPSPADALKAAFPARVLVAEDNEINQLVASEILTRSGFQCQIVGDGRQAFDASAREEFDLILMDCQMPEMDGFQATAAIRHREAGNTGKPSRIPIIALTANALAGDRERCIAAGMDDHLPKPLDPRLLITTLNRMLVGRRPVSTFVTEPPVITPSPAPSSPFDRDDLIARCMGDEAFCNRLLSAFPRQAEMWMSQITGAVAAGDVTKLRSAAHGLKGTAANLSAVEVRRLASEIESLARDGHAAVASDLLNALRVQIDHCIKAVAANVPASPTQGVK